MGLLMLPMRQGMWWARVAWLQGPKLHGCRARGSSTCLASPCHGGTSLPDAMCSRLPHCGHGQTDGGTEKAGPVVAALPLNCAVGATATARHHRPLSIACLLGTHRWCLEFISLHLEFITLPLIQRHPLGYGINKYLTIIHIIIYFKY